MIIVTFHINYYSTLMSYNKKSLQIINFLIHFLSTTMRNQEIKILITTAILLLIWVMTTYLLWDFQQQNLNNNLSLNLPKFFSTRIHIKSIMFALIIWWIIFFLPKKVFKNKRFEIVFFIFTLLLTVLSMIPWIGTNLDGKMRLDIFNIISIQPIYLYIVWSILILSKFNIKNSPYLKYILLQIIISIPLVLTWSFVYLLILWIIGSIMFLYHKPTFRLRCSLINIIVLAISFWFILPKQNLIEENKIWCVQFSNSENTDNCYQKLSIKKIFNEWKIFWVWHKKWELVKEIPDIKWSFVFAGIWESFGILWRIILLWLYFYLFSLLYKSKKNSIIIWLSSYLLIELLINILINIWLLPYIQTNLLLISFSSYAIIAQILSIVIITRNLEN